jgi:O-antigen/teichoic acid export membrane protein
MKPELLKIRDCFASLMKKKACKIFIKEGIATSAQKKRLLAMTDSSSFRTPVSARVKQSHLLLSALIILLSVILPGTAFSQDKLKVYYSGPQGSVSQAIVLAKNFELTLGTDADVFVINGKIEMPSAIHTRIKEGAGMVLIMGPDIKNEDLNILLGTPVSLKPLKKEESIDNFPGAAGSIITDIVWNSAPQVRERMEISGLKMSSLVYGYASKEIIIGKTSIGKSQVYVFTPYLTKTINKDGKEELLNKDFQEWPYFNYFIYNLTTSASGKTPQTFADYPASPVPHKNERFAIISFLLLVNITFFTLFIFVRRYSNRHPEALDNIVGNRENYDERERGTDWENIGFHRPLGGFLFALTIGLILFVPLIIYQNLILPTFLLPSAQGLGLWFRVLQFFEVTWFFFDMGTSMAFVKFLSEYRVSDPKKGIQFGQMFVWWQMLTGAVQVTIFVALSSFFLPKTTYAIYTWIIITHAIIQMPGIYQLMRYALPGFQRFDYAQIVDIGFAVVFPIIAQLIVVFPVYKWGLANPVIGPALGGALGMAFALYGTELLTFIIGYFLYHRLGYNMKILFLAHFDWEVIKKSLKFGVFDMMGSLVVSGAQALEILITQTKLINYTEIWGNWMLAKNFVFAYNVVLTLYGNLMPAISEAFSRGRKILSQYYAALAYKYGGMISGFLGAFLLAVSDRFILGATGPQFDRAALYSIPLMVWGMIQYPSWIGDNIQRGVNKPWLITALCTMEQTIRVTLVFVLMDRFQIIGLIIAYFVGLLTKDIVSYFINDKLCFKQRFFFWQSIGAPILSGAVMYAILRTLGTFIWKCDQITSMILFFLGAVPGLYVFSFLYALAGGWDAENLEELKHGAQLSNFMKPMAMLFYKCAELGAKISPLHNRFPITIRQEALAEAQSLMKEKVEL